MNHMSQLVFLTMTCFLAVAAYHVGTAYRDSLEFARRRLRETIWSVANGFAGYAEQGLISFKRTVRELENLVLFQRTMLFLLVCLFFAVLFQSCLFCPALLVTVLLVASPVFLAFSRFQEDATWRKEFDKFIDHAESEIARLKQ